MAKKRVSKKTKAKPNAGLELLLKNAENDPEAYEMLQALKLQRDKASKGPTKAKSSPPQKQGRQPKAKIPSEIRVNKNLRNRTKSPGRVRQIRITKNEFDPSKFKNAGRDKDDTILRKQNVIVENARPSYEPVEVECSACHRIDVVPPGYITSDYYRCVGCSKT